MKIEKKQSKKEIIMNDSVKEGRGEGKEDQRAASLAPLWNSGSRGAVIWLQEVDQEEQGGAGWRQACSGWNFVEVEGICGGLSAASTPSRAF